MTANKPTYLYRCTEDKLQQHLERIHEAGDSVEHAIYKGGRDYVLVVRRGPIDGEPATVRLDEDTVTRLAAAVVAQHQRATKAALRGVH